MRKSPLQSELEKKFWALETLRAATVRNRGGPPVAAPDIPGTYSASLSGDGVLSFVSYRTDRFGLRARAASHRKINARLYERFVSLADADGEHIRRFAEHWGPLRYPRSLAEPADSETLEQWRRFARLARALLRCAVLSGQRQPGLPEDWRALCEWVNYAVIEEPVHSIGLIIIATALNQWYAASPLNSLVLLQKDRLILQPSSWSLFGIIGLQLASRITGAEDSRVCYHCKRFYIPKNQPRTGIRSFCPSCRRAGKPVMYAMRDHRAREKRRG